MTLFVLRNELDVSRLGIIATRRLGGGDAAEPIETLGS